MALNPLGVEDVNNDEMCIICHDLLSTAPTYTLPECKHQYHTHCIVTWFRHSKSCGLPTYNYNLQPTYDGRCPHCGDTGINNNTENNQPSQNYRYITRSEIELFKINRKYAKNKEAPDTIKRDIEKLKNYEKELENHKKEITQFKKSLKEKTVNYYDANKELKKNKKKVWGIQRKIAKMKRQIAGYHIVPLIIPKPVDIN